MNVLLWNTNSLSSLKTRLEDITSLLQGSTRVLDFLVDVLVLCETKTPLNRVVGSSGLSVPSDFRLFGVSASSNRSGGVAVVVSSSLLRSFAVEDVPIPVACSSYLDVSLVSFEKR